MSKRITITLTDAEYAALAARAEADRRTPAQQAAYLATRPTGLTFTPDWTYRPIPAPTMPYVITTDKITYDPNRLTIWNNATGTAVVPMNTWHEGKTG